MADARKLRQRGPGFRVASGGNAPALQAPLITSDRVLWMPRPFGANGPTDEDGERGAPFFGPDL
jgi:hypothetical protein